MREREGGREGGREGEKNVRFNVCLPPATTNDEEEKNAEAKEARKQRVRIQRRGWKGVCLPARGQKKKKRKKKEEKTLSSSYPR